MPLLHHVNLGVPVGGIEAQSAFLIDVLGFHEVEPPPELAHIAHWFDDDDGIQIHLSADPEHRAPARAHVAVTIDDVDVMRKRLESTDISYRVGGSDTVQVLFCADPSGNQWELRRPVDS